MKSNPNYDLFKIPDSAIVKNQAVEIGVLKAEIEELKYDVIELKKEVKSKIKTIKKRDSKIKWIENGLTQLKNKSKECNYWKTELRKIITLDTMEFHFYKINELQTQLKNK